MAFFFSVSMLPTHGLVSGGYRSRMMQYQDFSLKLPSGLWAQPWRNHHHPFSYWWALDLSRVIEEVKTRGHRWRNTEMFIFQHSFYHFSWSFRKIILDQWGMIRNVGNIAYVTMLVIQNHLQNNTKKAMQSQTCPLDATVGDIPLLPFLGQMTQSGHLWLP